MQRSRRRRRRRPNRVDPPGRAERAAVILEAALALPLFLALVFGIIEGSLLLRDHLAVANITGQAGRAASTFGNDADADFQIIQEVRRAAAGISVDNIIRVVVFRASGPDTPVPNGCRNGTPTSVGANPCNVYPTSAFGDDDPTHFDCSTSAPYSSRYWCPTDRRIALNGPGSPPDYLGIHIRINHTSVTQMFGGDRVIERTSIFRLEPQVLNG